MELRIANQSTKRKKEAKLSREAELGGLDDDSDPGEDVSRLAQPSSI